MSSALRRLHSCCSWLCECCRSNSAGRALTLSSWLLNATNALHSSVVSNLAPYITSEFGAHNFAPIIMVVVDTCMAMSYLFGGRLVDTFNRLHFHLGGAVIATIGLALLAATESLVAYCAANVLYAVGWSNIALAGNSLLFSVSKRTHAVLIRTFNLTPRFLTAVAGPPLATYFHTFNWRWSHGTFSIAIPVISTLMAVFLFNSRRPHEHEPRRSEQDRARVTRQGWPRTVWRFCIEFDLLGALLFCVGSGLLLLSFSFAESTPNSWRAPHILGMVAGGSGALLLAAAVEKWVAPNPFFPFKTLKDRTTLGIYGMCLTCGGECSTWNHLSPLLLR